MMGFDEKINVIKMSMSHTRLAELVKGCEKYLRTSDLVMYVLFEVDDLYAFALAEHGNIPPCKIGYGKYNEEIDQMKDQFPGAFDWNKKGELLYTFISVKCKCCNGLQVVFPARSIPE